MSARRPCPAAPGLLEGYAARFDDLFGRLAQRRGFREYLAGLLAPRHRNKTLTALAGAEPVTGAQHPAVQRLQFFLSESRWDADQVNARRLELLLADPATAPHEAGVLVIDDSGDRKDGTRTARRPPWRRCDSPIWPGHRPRHPGTRPDMAGRQRQLVFLTHAARRQDDPDGSAFSPRSALGSAADSRLSPASATAQTYGPVRRIAGMPVRPRPPAARADRRQLRSWCAASASCRSAWLTWPKRMGSDAATYPSGRIR